MMGIPRILSEIRRNGDRFCGNTMGMEMGAAGMRQDGTCFFVETPSGCFRNLADDKNSVASVRTLVKLSRCCKMCS